MQFTLRVSRRAAAEIEKAERWWLANRPAAPDALHDDLSAVFRWLVQRPGIGVELGNTKLPGVRRLTLGRVRYYLYYRVSESELVVLGLWHTSRRPPKL